MISLNNITKRYGDKDIFRDFSFCFPQQAVTCIYGKSGCGKTTLLHMILGLIKPDSGTVGGLKGMRTAAVFQEDRLCEGFSAAKNIQIVSPGVNKQEIHRHFIQVGLRDCESKSIQELSGGMKRRVAIVRAILYRPEILVMDEPFQGLDDQTRKQMIAYIRGQVKGSTVLLVTHNWEDAACFGTDSLLKL